MINIAFNFKLLVVVINFKLLPLANLQSSIPQYYCARDNTNSLGI
ncbi:hypothetical protein GLYMA_06G316550v4 [Glycine max]|nr:hypothetical protein GLYMA_06G316550v4 [Glycine max]KAH1128467.1 hypothetical protein GYH30_016837 [Glycine max]